MNKLNDRNFMIYDGTYANVPDLHEVEPSRKIGIREFNNSVLIHNWYEDRTPNETKEFPTNSTYNLDFKPYPDAKPDLILKRKILGGSEGVGGKNLIGMHNFDSSKNMITTYDETICNRPRPGPDIPFGQQYPKERKWKIINDAWVPEKVDYPLQASPTKWGLVEKQKNNLIRENDKYTNQWPNVTEYSDRFQRHSKESYLNRVTTGVPKDVSTNHYDLNIKLNNAPKPRTTNSTSLRLPQARDVLDTVYANMLIKSSKAPRTFYYLGKIPTNGALDVYSMRDFETLDPVNQPQRIKSVFPEKDSNLETMNNY